MQKESVWAKSAHTAEDGKVYQVDYYNLDVIISVGYRVKSLRGTQFRIWANSVLKEYLLKGFAMNDELLKKVFWRKVLDIYATSMDYDPRMEASVLFFKISMRFLREQDESALRWQRKKQRKNIINSEPYRIASLQNQIKTL